MLCYVMISEYESTCDEDEESYEDRWERNMLDIKREFQKHLGGLGKKK